MQISWFWLGADDSVEKQRNFNWPLKFCGLDSHPACCCMNLHARRHGDVGVHGLWLEVNHSGQTSAPTTLLH